MTSARQPATFTGIGLYYNYKECICEQLHSLGGDFYTFSNDMQKRGTINVMIKKNKALPFAAH